MPSQHCRGLTLPPFQQACNTQPCPTLTWAPSNSWSACSAPCDSRNGSNLTTTTDPRVLGLTTSLPPTCVRTDQVTGTSTAVATEQCVSAGLVPPQTTASCNRFPCPAVTVSWRVGQWGPCMHSNTSSTVLQCGVGVQTRSVECALASRGSGDGTTGGVVVDGACMAPGSTAPVREQECFAGACGCETASDCASRGTHFTCGDDGDCACEEGWSGSDCDVLLLLPVGADCSSTAVVDVNGTCCDSVIDSVTGLCCGSGGVVDGDGRCCPDGGTVDACGVCGGDGLVLDVAGACCSHALAPSGLCCDGSLDSCGVCDGTNECDAVLSLSIPAGVDITASDIAAAIGVVDSAVVINISSSSGSTVGVGVVQGEAVRFWRDVAVATVTTWCWRYGCRLTPWWSSQALVVLTMLGSAWDWRRGTTAW